MACEISKVILNHGGDAVAKKLLQEVIANTDEHETTGVQIAK